MSGDAHQPGGTGGSGGSGGRPGGGSGNGNDGSSHGGGGSGRGTGGNGANGGTGSSGASSAEEECPTVGCRDGYSVITIPDVTAEDLASFVPARPGLGGEPAGFGVVGMPANLLGTASPHTLSGPLLGWDVEVRFTPVGFVFQHGDGTSARRSTGGATWSALGLPQFSPTATSHVYRERGTYTVDLTVEYSAAVNFGSGWRPVPGVVRSTGPSYTLDVLDVRTALVDRTCAEAPAGPGC